MRLHVRADKALSYLCFVGVLGGLLRADPAAIVASSIQSLAVSSSTVALTLKGTAAYTAGSEQESGPITLAIDGVFESTVTFEFNGARRVDTQLKDSRQWSGFDGVVHDSPRHNALITAGWFDPGAILQAWQQDPSVQVQDLGTEDFNGTPVHRLHCIRDAAPEASAVTRSLIQQASAMDLLIDSNTNLPIAFLYNEHSDKDAAMNAPVRIEYSDFRPTAIGQVPFHIQKYLQCSLLLDISVSSAEPASSGSSANLTGN